MKVIIAGGRDFNDYEYLKNTLRYSFPSPSQIEVVSGMARGADMLGARLARDYKLRLHKFPADWDKFGKSAGFIRNEQMAKFADACFIFWDGKSPGSKSMIDLARKHNLKLMISMYDK